VSTRISIRNGLLAVALLAAIVCGVSIWAVARVMSHSQQQRIDRARDAVTLELDLLASERGGAANRTVVSLVAMRGGRVPAGAAVPEPNAPYASGLARAMRRAETSSSPVVETLLLEEGETAIVGARRAEDGSVAWGAYLVRPPSFQRTFRIALLILVGATVLLVTISIFAVVSVHRGAASIRASLDVLAKDPAARVPRPVILELSETASGVEGLARELARAEAERRRLGSELADRERLAALGRVVAGVAHEVRNPLASIKLRLDLAAMSGRTPPELVDELGRASAEIARLDRLVADLLVVAGRRSGPKRETDLGELARERAELLEPWAAERGVVLRVSGAATADVDRDRISQAVDNLLRNAVEASPVGAVASVDVTERGEAAVISVSDRGPGVDSSRTSELFEPFFTTKPAGTGLGLALSRAIARAHGGTLVYARDAGSSRFDIEIPRRAPALEDAAE
jgi:signal transduction histidine kinase